MKFKLKAWHIYLIFIVVIPSLFTFALIPALIYTGYFTEPFDSNENFISVFVSVLTSTILYGGILLAIYYGLKRIFVKDQKSQSVS